MRLVHDQERGAALPVELEPVNQQAIGASLGDDAIIQGRNALMLGLLAVFVPLWAREQGRIAKVVE